MAARARIFETKVFARLAKGKIDKDALVECIEEAEDGLIEADLGKGLIKKRVGRAGQGKRGSYRVVLMFRAGMRAVFLTIFAKSAQANLSRDEKDAFQKLAASYLKYTDEQISSLLKAGELVEIPRGEKHVK